jgi:superfamily II DNA or RNA helicase
MSVALTESLFSQAAGWEAMKRARAYLAQDQVLSSDWTPPRLLGVVQAGETSYRAGLVILSAIDIDNLCTCRESREWGKICAHSVAVGLHHLQKTGALAVSSPSAQPKTKNPEKPQPTGPARRLHRAPAGEPLELFLILPPNFEQAAARGKVMLCLEARGPEGRAPLNTLPMDQPFALSLQDDAVLARVESLAGEPAVALLLEAKDFAALLPLLIGHPRLTLGKNSPLRVESEPWQPSLRARLEPDGDIVLTLRERAALPARLGADWVFENAIFRPIGLPLSLRGVLDGPVRLGRAQVPVFLSQDWPVLEASGAVEADFKLEDFVIDTVAPEFHLELAGGLARLDATLYCAGGGQRWIAGRGAEAACAPDPANPRRYALRDLAAERAALGRLQRAGFTGPDAQGRLQLTGQESVLNFFAREFPRLQRAWRVTLEERLERSTRQNLERIQPRFDVRASGTQWFDLGVVFDSTGGEVFSPVDIQRLLLSGQGHTRLKNGRFALLDTDAVQEFNETLLDCAPRQEAGGYRIRAEQAAFLEATLREQPGWQVQAPAGWRERAARQRGDALPVCPPLGSLDTVLRPYQKAGVAWLLFLRENGFGGVLADEMGLGKTLQVLALLEWLRCNPQRGNGRLHLVVCPSSLVFNWQAEAKRFTPGLRVLALHGPDRHTRLAEISRCDLVVTSYALLRRDADRYAGLEFDTVVLDEAQHIKNRQTQNARAVKGVRAAHRLALTGTPLENSVLDLWSLFDFLMPGYLGGTQEFRERYELPITRDRDAAAQARLARRLRPFLLRRLKREVAPELPARLEQIALCELTPEQRALYEQILHAGRNEILAATGPEGQARSRILVLNTLLRLRQVCCDPRLLDAALGRPAPETSGDEATGAPASSPAVSGKLEHFAELLEEVIDGGHRALVFSQFTSMLALLRQHLDAEGIEYCYLDGSTTDRAAVVARFQRTASVPVFLISLKAGGVGLNLTGADTVIHFDPWWNPAVEDQATDRAHRIGQTRVVTSYKLIARDTVEEKILALQARKREVIRASLGGEEEFTATLTWEEIQGLLAG